MKTSGDIIKFIDERIAHLKKIDSAFCDICWDMTKSQIERVLAREESNNVTFGRHELESLKSFIEQNNS